MQKCVHTLTHTHTHTHTHSEGGVWKQYLKSRPEAGERGGEQRVNKRQAQIDIRTGPCSTSAGRGGIEFANRSQNVNESWMQDAPEFLILPCFKSHSVHVAAKEVELYKPTPQIIYTIL